MKKYLVTFPIARIAKELGFNWPSNYYYLYTLTGKINSETGEWETELNLYEGHFTNHSNLTDISDKNYYMCSAMPWATLQDWVLENYGFLVGSLLDTNGLYYWFIQKKKGECIKSSIYNKEFQYFHSIKLAMDAGFEEVFKYITQEKCSCEMPAKVKNQNICWRCEKILIK